MNHFYFLREGPPTSSSLDTQSWSYNNSVWQSMAEQRALEKRVEKAAYFRWLNNPDSDATQNWLLAEREQQPAK